MSLWAYGLKLTVYTASSVLLIIYSSASTSYRTVLEHGNILVFIWIYFGLLVLPVNHVTRLLNVNASFGSNVVGDGNFGFGFA